MDELDIKITGYPGLVRAAKALCLSNGAINRLETFDPSRFVIETTHDALEHVRSADRILGMLSDEDMDTLCDGEESEAAKVLAVFDTTAARCTNEVLNALFAQI